MFINKKLLRHVFNDYKHLSYQLTQPIINNNITKMSGEFDVVYKSLDTILDVLKKSENISLEPISKIVSIYNRIKNEETLKHVKNELYPLIVLEGLDGCGKSTLSKRLSSTLNAELCSTPPKCLKEFRPIFDLVEYKSLRPVFYSLGNYIAALEMKTILQYKPVVLDRYWHSTSAYALAQAIEDNDNKYNLPEENDPLYSWPTDLLLPDKIFFLEVSEHVRLRRIGGRVQLTTQEHLIEARQRFRSNIFTAYKRMYNPKVIMIKGDLKKRQVEHEILKHLEDIPVFQQTARSVLGNR